MLEGREGESLCKVIKGGQVRVRLLRKALMRRRKCSGSLFERFKKFHCSSSGTSRRRVRRLQNLLLNPYSVQGFGEIAHGPIKLKITLHQDEMVNEIHAFISTQDKICTLDHSSQLSLMLFISEIALEKSTITCTQVY